jgi:hypothetical protein
MDQEQRQIRIAELQAIIKQKEIYRIGGTNANKEKQALKALLEEEAKAKP